MRKVCSRFDNKNLTHYNDNINTKFRKIYLMHFLKFEELVLRTANQIMKKYSYYVYVIYDWLTYVLYL